MTSSNFNGLLLAAALFTLFTTTGCDDDGPCISGSGATITEELNLEDFHSIDASGSWDVTIEQADQQRVEVTGQQNIIDDIKRDVNNGVWDMSLQDDECYENFNLTVRIWIPDLRAIDLSGSGRIVLNSFDSLQNLDIDISGSGIIFQSGVMNIEESFTVNSSGSGDVTANLHASRILLDFSGTGAADLTGSTDYQSISIEGAGNIAAFDMISDTAVVDISGTGNLELTVEEYLNVFISGTGDVYYRGYPTVDSNITGTGRLIDAN